MKQNDELTIWQYGGPQEYEAMIYCLKQDADPEYLAFNQRIIPGLGLSYGVRFPHLRRMANALARNPEKDGVWKRLAAGESFEERILAGMTVNRLTSNGFLPVHVRLLHMVDRINNWSVCDTMAGGLREWVTCDVGDFLSVLQGFLKDERAWARRFGIVLLLHLREKPWVSQILSITGSFVNEEEYYVQMAVAWLVSMFYFVSPEEVEQWLKDYPHTTIVNLTVRKILDSRQLGHEERSGIRQFKRSI